MMDRELVENIYGSDFYKNKGELEPDQPFRRFKSKSPEPPNQVYIKEGTYNDQYGNEYIDETENVEGSEIDYDEQDIEMLNQVHEEVKRESLSSQPSHDISDTTDIDFLRQHVMPLLGGIISNKKLQVRIRLQQVLMSELLNYKNVRTASDQLMKSSNYDELFLFSLLPYMASTYDYRKSIVRSKMLDILKDELEDECEEVKDEIAND